MIPSRPIRSLAAAACLAVLAAGGALGARTPALPISNVGYENALLDALLVASQKEGRSIVRLDGDSMLPFFGANSIGVVQAVDAARLRPGMIAVYQNRFGETVAHRVIAAVDGGWQVQGYNNREADSTVVNGSNLRGVLYATFETSGYNPLFATTLANVPVAIGAPAK